MSFDIAKYPTLALVDSTQELRLLPKESLPKLCDELRRYLLDSVSRSSGHFASGLGTVELTVALHYVYNTPFDQLIWDVGHQAYPHKILTGRRDKIGTIRQKGGLHPFPWRGESEYDVLSVGHSSTSISAGIGIAVAAEKEGKNRRTVCVIGDGAITAGMAFEAMNHAGDIRPDMLVVLNDNEMSIAEDFGGMYGQLAKLRASDGTAELNLFKAFGLDYRYVEQGNDIDTLVEVLNEVKGIDHPIVVHIRTTKGLGFDDGEESDNGSDGCNQTNPQPHAGKCEANHWQDPEASLGKPLDARKYYGEMAMASLERRFSSEPGLVVISPATPGSNGITRDFRERAGAHYVDTGITEEHAAAFAAGIAKAGGRPVLATSATFFQRTFDQLQQELALNHVPATLLIFGAGISGADNTHSGAFDMTMFANVPDVTCLAPASGEQMLDMLAWATGPSEHGVVAIRMPGEQILALERAADMAFDPLQRAEEHDPAVNIAGECPFTRYQIVQPGKDVAILGLGNTMPLAAEITSALAEDDATHAAITATLVDALQYSTMDAELLTMLADGHRLVVTLEDGQLEGGWGEKVTAFYANSNNAKASHVRVLNFGASKEFTNRVPLDELNERYGLTTATIVSRIRGILNE